MWLAVKLKAKHRIGTGPGFTEISTNIVKSSGGSCPGIARDVEPRLEGLLSALVVLLKPVAGISLSLVAQSRDENTMMWSKISLKQPKTFLWLSC